MLPKELIDLLICPKCGEKVKYAEDQNYLFCDSCGKKYNIVDDIPVMIINEEENGSDIK